MAEYLAQKQNPVTLDPDQQFEILLEKIRTGPHTMDLDRIRAAYEMARDAHTGQKRKDGSPYVTHCIAAADISVDIGLDEDSIIAALLQYGVIPSCKVLCRHLGLDLGDCRKPFRRLTEEQERGLVKTYEQNR